MVPIKENKNKNVRNFQNNIPNAPAEEKSLPDEEKILKQMLHLDEKTELANDLVEWEDDGEGHFLFQ